MYLCSLKKRKTFRLKNQALAKMNVRDIREYLVIFIGEFAHHHHLNVRQTYQYLRQYKALDFLEQQYEVAHTMGFEYMVNAMTEYCKRNGGYLS